MYIPLQWNKCSVRTMKKQGAIVNHTKIHTYVSSPITKKVRMYNFVEKIDIFSVSTYVHVISIFRITITIFL